MDEKKVCVVGGGASGLVALKSALEAGFSPICFEKSADIGGLWRYKPQPTNDEASVMSSTVINTSKELMAFSDFPPPPQAPNLMPHTQSIKKTEDYENTGQWVVTVQNQVSVEELIFDAVLLCTGHHVDPNFPFLPGIDYFKGTMLHSQDYKEREPFRGRRVAIVGIGNSAVDIAVDLAHSAAQVWVCSRRGAWIQGKLGQGGLPSDLSTKTRAATTVRRLFPAYFAHKAQNLVRHRLGLLSIEPKVGIWEAHPTESEELPACLVAGTVQMKPGLQGVRVCFLPLVHSRE